MTAPDPRANPLLRGHEAAEAMLAEAMRSGRMHHAWLITGPAGIGKATLAFRFARRLLAGMPDANTLELPESHPVLRRTAAGSHADLLTVEREWDPKRKRLRGEIVVDDVRRVSEFLRLTPAEGGWRVVVLDGAEDLNRNAANALLKVLEEPPARAMLLLVCSAAGRLLPTIRSRCRRLRLAPLAETDIAALLQTYMPELDADQRLRLSGLAEGSIGRALQLAEGEGVAFADMVSEVMDALPNLTTEKAHAVADALGRNEDAFSTFMDLLRAAVAAAVRDAARGRTDPDQARMLGARPLDAWVDVWHALTRLQDETENAYLDKRQAIVTGLGLLANAH
ncbi:DNA polymerase III subunit delta' [Limobrevibacterium gyesilva]|uniref:DNA polymerase III subunit delta n=1 Tax=Limobrevibacterium gyesilva TaxID=2991712 RepID=A0AA41YK49_9PROT|nr:DNA polymerase III subunit delta' [Limobrevibacterium gyesilva]